VNFCCQSATRSADRGGGGEGGGGGRGGGGVGGGGGGGGGGIGCRLFLSAGAGDERAPIGRDPFMYSYRRRCLQLENPLKNPALRPAAETLMHALPIADSGAGMSRARNNGSEPV